MQTVVVKAGEEPDIVCVEPGREATIRIVDWNAYRGSPIEYVYELTWEPEVGRPALTGRLEGEPFRISDDMVTMRRQFELADCSGIKPVALGCAFDVSVVLDDKNVTGLLGFKAHTKGHQFRGKIRVTTLPPFDELVKS